MKKIDTEDWARYVYYDPSSPSGLRWKVDRFTGANGRVPLARAGDVAGNKRADGYYRVGLHRYYLTCHRLVLALHGHNLDSFCVDHKDGNRGNNRIENLRLTTYQGNGRNRKLDVRNKSGVVGVRLRREKRASGKIHESWVANWMDLNGKLWGKGFSVADLGNEGAFKAACNHRAKEIAKMNNSGAGYTERHGT